MASTINTFTKSGKIVKGGMRSGVPLANLGTKAADGTIWQHPRVTNNPLKGSSVKVTNPRVAGPAAQARTASLGMGRVGQRGRVTDLPNQLT